MPDTHLGATSGVPMDLRRALQIFDYKQLSPKQEELILPSIAGKDTLGILPTGGGKSACFQIPGIVRNEMTVVISPLIALQDDQVQALRRRKIKAFALHSGLTDAERNAVYFYFKRTKPGQASFLYVSPELFVSDAFHRQLGGVPFTRAAIDEAHCVSTWGNTFRPDFLRIAQTLDRLKIKIRSAFTATVDVRIEQDIRTRLGLAKDCVCVKANPHRENLKISVEFPNEVEDKRKVRKGKKFSRLVGLLTLGDFQGPSIVYYESRARAADAYLSLRHNMYIGQADYTPYLFHADLPHEDKVQALEGFLEDERPLVLATTAFGMGVDRPDVRQIIHYDLPYTLIDYAQQIGRAGRDGKDSLCTTLRLLGEGVVNEGRALMGMPTMAMVESVHRRLSFMLAKHHTEGKEYNVSKFLYHLAKSVEGSKYLEEKDAYLRRAIAAFSLLRRVGVVTDVAGNLKLLSLIPSTPIFKEVEAMIEAQRQMMLREEARLKRFYGVEQPNQELLWQILSQKD